MSALVGIVILFLLLAACVAVYYVRRSEPVPPTVALPIDDEEDPRDRQARIEALEERGAELLHRRAELDATRGALGGNTQIFNEFDELETRLRSGEISEDEFERRKIELLGG